MDRVVGWRGVGLRLLGDADLIDALFAELPRFFSPQRNVAADATITSSDGVLSLVLPDGLGFTGLLSPETMRAASSRFELCVVDHLPELIAVHAGVVALKGAVVLLPGTSMAGKSTLVRALLNAGFEYLSDEFALVTAEGMVLPYPRRMTLRSQSGSSRVMPARTWNVDHPPAPVRVIALLTYSDGPWQASPITPAQGVLRLIENTVNARRNPGGAMRALSALARSAHCLAGSRGEADAAVIELLRVFDVE